MIFCETDSTACCSRLRFGVALDQRDRVRNSSLLWLRGNGGIPWGYPRIAQQMTLAFGIQIYKDIVRRILSLHYRPDSDSGPLADVSRCQSATLTTQRILVVMDQFTRRIIGLGVHRGTVDGAALCRMFYHAIRGSSLPKYLSFGS